MKSYLVSVCLLSVCSAPQLRAADYLIVDLAGADDPYYAAAKRLEELRGGEVVSADVHDLTPLKAVFSNKQPRYVAVVVRPDDFDVNLARRFLKLATEVDEDPFVDFAYGFITGDTPSTAVSLAEGASIAEKTRRPPTIGLAAVGEKIITKSSASDQAFPLRKATLPQLWGQIAGAENFPDRRDAKFIKQLMPRLQGKSMILFAGHGLPGEVLGGPTSKDLEAINFDGSVVMNIACLTGVTGKWFEEDWQQGKKCQRVVAKDKSFCLAMLRTGAAAYVAYACPRPAGPELFTDFAALAAEGLSVGEVRRRDYNRVVLASIANGFDRVKIIEEADGQPIQPRHDLVKDLLLDMATGGVLFGDPMFTPFSSRPEETPIEMKIEQVRDGLRATVSIGGQHVFLECSDQLAMWDADTQAMRILAIVPLGKEYVSAVRLTELTTGGKIAEQRLVWAVEENRGERWLHVKANFPMPGLQNQAALFTGVRAVFEIDTTTDAAKSDITSIRARRL
jgi:hypothetical protein